MRGLDGAILFEGLAAIATVGALAAAIWQLWVGNRDRRDAEQSTRSDRAMKLFDEVVAGGDTAKAFHELSVYLRKLGTGESGEVTWYLAQDHDLSQAGVFSPAQRESEIAFANLYTVLWFFERVDGSLQSRVIDPETCYRTLGFHIWWWDQLLRGVSTPKARAALTVLADWATRQAESKGQLDNWIARCSSDFAGGGADERGTGAAAASTPTNVPMGSNR